MKKVIGVTFGLLVAAAILLAIIPATRDDIHWIWASHNDEKADYEAYMDKWPIGRHATEAYARYDEYVWADAQAANTVQAFEQYLKQHGNGNYVAEARNSIEMLHWQEATEANTIRAFSNYALLHPKGKHLQKSEAKVAALQKDNAPFKAALKAGTEDSLKQFVADFPGHRKEQEVRKILADIAEGFSIVDLLRQKKIEIETQGNGIKSVLVRIRKRVPYPITVRIPVGSYFVSSRRSAQNMVVTAESKVLLTGNDWQSVLVSAACANRPKDIPGSQDTFTVQRSPHQAELARLMPFLDKAGVSFAVRQAAVWIVTDNADYNDLGIFVSRSQLQVYGGTRQIREYESAKAMRICEKAGINIIRKAIWKDRQTILSGLKDGQLREWLEKRAKETEHLALMYEFINQGDVLQKENYWCNVYSSKMTDRCRQSRKDIVKAYSKAIQAAPGYAEAYYKRGLFLRNISVYPTNARWMIFRDNPTPMQSELMKKYLEQIDKKKFNENLLQSVKDLSKALKIDPGNTSYFYVRAFTYIVLSDFDNALEDYNILIQSAPKEAPAYFYRAISRISDKPTISDYNLTIRDFTRAINLDPKKGHFYSARAKTWLDLKKYNASISDYKKCIELGYSHAGWDYYYYGIALTGEKLFDEAVNAFNLFLKECHPINRQGVQARKDAEFRISQLAR